MMRMELKALAAGKRNFEQGQQHQLYNEQDQTEQKQSWIWTRPKKMKQTAAKPKAADIEEATALSLDQNRAEQRLTAAT